VEIDRLEALRGTGRLGYCFSNENVLGTSRSRTVVVGDFYTLSFEQFDLIEIQDKKASKELCKPLRGFIPVPSDVILS